ncbi:MAG: amidohydrolase family protein, partial [Pseudomonadota bacterium]
EEGVRRITSAPARVLGLTDRGVLAPGQRADINVIDLANCAAFSRRSSTTSRAALRVILRAPAATGPPS